MADPISTYQIIDLLIKAAALVGVVVAFLQFRNGRRSHSFTVYKAAMDELDAPEVRQARQWVYKLKDRDRYLFKSEDWLALTDEPTKELSGDRFSSLLQSWRNKQRAELVGRRFDRIGLLIREGRIPVDLVARFYTTPTLRCWYQLAPYIEALRHDRKQTGHFWEFENLALEIIVPGVRSGLGVWEGIQAHENLRSFQPEGSTDVVDLLDIKHLPNWDWAYDPGENLWFTKIRHQLRYFVSELRSRKRRAA